MKMHCFHGNRTPSKSSVATLHEKCVGESRLAKKLFLLIPMKDHNDDAMVALIRTPVLL